MRKPWRATVIFLLPLFIGAGAFTFYLWTLYQQLEVSFSQQGQFIPTRIYSDVWRLSPPQAREQIQNNLKKRGYSYREAREADDSLIFTLNPINYPTYLIPDGHQTADLAGKVITLIFDGQERTSALQSIQFEGTEITELYLEPELVATLARGTKEIREPIRFESVPAIMWKAIISIEDQHFLEHRGLDPRGIVRAIWVNLRTFSLAQGGSTITQQLVKNLMLRRTKDIFRKINEVFLALILETRFEKERILERYLNEVYLGQVGSLEVHGVAEGAKHFFGKRIEEINLAEAALIAGLIRGPGFYSPYRYLKRAIDRQRLVIKKMVETGQIAAQEAEVALETSIRLAPPQTSTNKAPYFTDYVRAELIRELKDRLTEEEMAQAGLRIYTTLDMDLSSMAQNAISDGVLALEKSLRIGLPNHRLEGALAAVDHNTGFIRALIGGRNYTESTFNRILNMKRQVGSTFKPIVYLAAIAKGTDKNGAVYGPGYPIEDAPWELIYDRGRQKWAPKNYEKEFLGWTSLRAALAQSINVATAKLAVEVGIPEIARTARALGIESELPEVPALALGVAELSPVELLRVYATIANHGRQDELTVIRGITHDNGVNYARFVYHPKEVFPAGPIDLLTDMLQSVFIEGTARQVVKLGFERPAAGKTGTTSNHRDSWFAGFTPQLTTVVWVGMDQDQGATSSGSSKIKLTGASSALPIWTKFMKEALSSEAPEPFSSSQHLTSVRVDRRSGRKAPSDCPDSQSVVEKYLIENQPTGASCEHLWPASITSTTIER